MNESKASSEISSPSYPRGSRGSSVDGRGDRHDPMDFGGNARPLPEAGSFAGGRIRFEADGRPAV